MAIVQYTGVAPVPGTVVNVYFPATQMPAPIYADAILTPRSNPFSSDLLTGAYTFWADQQAYDVVLGQTGSPPLAPITTTDANFATILVNGIPYTASVAQDAFAFVDGANITMTIDPLTGITTVAAAGGGVTTPVGGTGAIQFDTSGAFDGQAELGYAKASGQLQIQRTAGGTALNIYDALTIRRPGDGVIQAQIGFDPGDGAGPPTGDGYQQIGFGQVDYLATDSFPAYIFKQANLGASDTIGVELLTNETLGAAITYANGLGYALSAVRAAEPNGFEVYQYGGLGATAAGMVVGITHNSDGSGAGATLGMNNKSGTRFYLWVDAAGKLRIGPARPTANGSVSDTSGTIVGTQT